MRLIDADKLQQRIIDEKDEIITDNHHAIGMHNGLTLAQAMIINAPTIEVPRWIPVSERLPEDGQIVLTCKNGICEVQTYEARRNGWVSGRIFWSMAFVTHWMPLPDAPKDGDT